jgi:hypothetical protein
LLTAAEADQYGRTRELPDHRGHPHVAKPTAQRMVDASEARWASEGKKAIFTVTDLTDAGDEPRRWRVRRSGADGPSVMQLIR